MDALAFWVGGVLGGSIPVALVAAAVWLLGQRLKAKPSVTTALVISVPICTAIAVYGGNQGDVTTLPQYAGLYATSAVLQMLGVAAWSAVRR